METKCIIEACNDEHEWCSDYVGNEAMTETDATAIVARLEKRSETDSENEDECSDGISWRGWHFRILRDDGDGYRSA